jgi:hypothetical protein
MTERICREWGREADFIRIAPDGYLKWNAIYEPGQPTWAVGYRLGMGERLRRLVMGGKVRWSGGLMG